MIYRLVVPKIGELKEIRLLAWSKQVGASIAKGDLIVELETDKALVEVRAGQSGYLRRTTCDNGSWYELGTLLGVVTAEPNDALPAEVESSPLLAADFELV